MALSVMEQNKSTQKKKDPLPFDWFSWFNGVLRHFQQYLRYIVAVSFIY
jgi:hypothetical protein